MIVILAEMIQKLERQELPAGMYLLQGQIAPLFINIEFNFSTKLLVRALTWQNETPEDLNKKLSLYGDIGLFLENYVTWQGEGISILEVYEELKAIALVSGKNSQTQKMHLFRQLLQKLSPLEAKFCGRIILGKLRLGVSDKTILDSLSWSVKGDKSLKPLLEKAYGSRADLPSIAESLLFSGEESLEQFQLEVGVPVSSKLVEREKSMERIFERMKPRLFVQPKYDGLRLQIHYKRQGFSNSLYNSEILKDFENVRLFSRNMTNITDMFPDVANEVRKLPVDSIILDSEVIGINPETGELMAFQDTVQRKRKYGVTEKIGQIPVSVFCFDILYLDGKSLLQTDLDKRIDILKDKIFKEDLGMIKMAETTLVDSIKDLTSKFKKYTAMGLEGLIAKTPRGSYEPGTRNYDWIKLKVKSQEELADSIDAVVLGYYSGTGKRTKFGIGALLVGIYNDEEDKYISLAKVGTGFKDADWGSMKKRIDKIKMQELPKNVVVNKNLVPDVIARPEIVVVIEADEISLSKIHGSGELRFSLRFPRFKYIREDKSAEQVTTMSEITRLYTIQDKTLS